MSKRSIIVLALLCLPYGYLAIFWSSCFVATCKLDGDMVFQTFLAIAALPFVMLISGGVLSLGGARRIVEAGPSGSAAPRTTDVNTKAGLRLSIGLWLMIVAIPGSAALLYLALDTPEPGRDRLGRICEQTGGLTVCRPDPDANHPSELDQLNRMMKRKRGSD